MMMKRSRLHSGQDVNTTPTTPGGRAALMAASKNQWEIVSTLDTSMNIQLTLGWKQNTDEKDPMDGTGSDTLMSHVSSERDRLRPLGRLRSLGGH